MPETSEITHSGNGNTTNADPVAFASLILNDHSSAHLNVRAIARCAANADTKMWEFSAFVKRTGETASITYTPTSPFGDAGAVGWGITIEEDGEFLNIVATGQTDTQIAWYITTVVRYIVD